jgi:TorA maturation chaperone TorD
MNAGGEIDVSHPEELARTAMEVSHLHGFLAAVFRAEVTPELLREIRKPEFASALAEAGVALGEHVLSAPEADVLEELAVEYAALFLGPGEHVSPHESVYAEHGTGSLWGEKTAEVLRYIKAAGFEYDESYRGIPDHISVELEFMAELARREAEAWARGDLAAAANCLEYEQDFIGEHLASWVPRFCDKAADLTESEFYRAIVRLTADFIAGEVDDISQRLAAAR